MNHPEPSLPFSLRAAPDLDFDELAELFRTDPEAFEARRRALLAIELAKGGVHAAPAARMLDDLEQRSAGASPEQRMALAAAAMTQSAQQLQGELTRLANELDSLHGALKASIPTQRD